MALSFPAAADTPLKRLHFLMRVHRRLILRHNNLSAQIETPEDLRQFKLWELDVWKPRLKRLSQYVATYRAATDQAGYTAVKTQQLTDTTWDASIDEESV